MDGSWLAWDRVRSHRHSVLLGDRPLFSWVRIRQPQGRFSC